MKTILTEKPSVAREIAAALNINGKNTGYLEGGGFYITWAFGHLVELCPPEDYGWKEWSANHLPMLPETFKLRPSHRYNASNKTWSADKGVLAQLAIIKRLFNGSDELIVATDAGREGELIFRYIYQHIGCTRPFSRLWISSLTGKSIIKGMTELAPGNRYNNLYASAKNRSEADWLVGMNASRALSIAAKKGTFSLGRVQTPTLSIICARYIENRDFTPTPYFTIKIKLEKDGRHFFAYTETIAEKDKASNLLSLIKKAVSAKVLKVEKKETVEPAPLLYDLTSLQRDANKILGLTADETLTAAQSLYEQKLITYPRTGSRYIPEDIFETIPGLLGVASSDPVYGQVASRLMGKELNRRPVDDEKITDHHAILITETLQRHLKGRERAVYQLVLSRMLESFSLPCKKDITTLAIDCAGLAFKAKGSVVSNIGWREIRSQKTSMGGDGDRNAEDGQTLPEVLPGDNLPKRTEELLAKLTTPKPLLNDASLLSAMETCGRDIEDETIREALKACGIGTPATRANIIETLLHRGYIERQQKLLVPTPKGLTVHDLLKTKLIASPEMTGQWEKRLNHIALGIADAACFMEDIRSYTKEITTELLGLSKELETAGLGTDSLSKTNCPKCKKGIIKKGEKNYWCSAYKEGCDFKIWLVVGGKKLSDKQVSDLLSQKKTSMIKGFRNKEGKAFDACLVLDENFKVRYRLTKNQ